MKLIIRREYFDQIKKGNKRIEFRDAHITFVNKETGETLRRNVNGVCIMPRGATHHELKNTVPNALFNRIFEDGQQIWFYLEEEDKNEADNNP